MRALEKEHCRKTTSNYNVNNAIRTEFRQRSGVNYRDRRGTWNKFISIWIESVIRRWIISNFDCCVLQCIWLRMEAGETRVGSGGFNAGRTLFRSPPFKKSMLLQKRASRWNQIIFTTRSNSGQFRFLLPAMGHVTETGGRFVAERPFVRTRNYHTYRANRERKTATVS